MSALADFPNGLPFGKRKPARYAREVNSLGLNEATITKYIREQEKQDQIEDKLRKPASFRRWLSYALLGFVQATRSGQAVGRFFWFFC